MLIINNNNGQFYSVRAARGTTPVHESSAQSQSKKAKVFASFQLRGSSFKMISCSAKLLQRSRFQSGCEGEEKQFCHQRKSVQDVRLISASIFGNN